MMRPNRLQLLIIVFVLVMAGCVTPMNPAIQSTVRSSDEPEQASTCPAEKPDLTFQIPPDFGALNADADLVLLQFLNSGGSPANLIHTLVQNYSLKLGREILQADLTGDSMAELVISPQWLFILGCDSGRYQTLMKAEPGICGFRPCALDITYAGDMNLDGISEIIIERTDAVNLISDLYFQIYAWNGARFENLVKNSNSTSCVGPDQHDTVQEDEMCIEYADTACYAGCVSDTDGNGTLEFVLEGRHARVNDGDPQIVKDVYIWDGKHFVFHSSTSSTPLR